jgi:para-aminobenzoate synthetase component 1
MLPTSVQRNIASFGLNDVSVFKQQMLGWANQFNICCFFDNHYYTQQYNTYECLLGAGAQTIFAPTNNIFCNLQQLCVNNKDWLFGHVNYNLNIETGSQPPIKTDKLQFPDIFLFQPSVVIEVNGSKATISSLTSSPEKIFKQICTYPIAAKPAITGGVTVNPVIVKEEYIRTIQQIQAHIRRGDCYELNFCQEFFADNALIDPYSVYNELTKLSPTPFSCYYKLQDKYLLCASPERYIKKMGDVIISQPIKGTAKRNMENLAEDGKLRQALQHSIKERSENVMIVDLVRNDLSKICREGTVIVEELFGVYPFPQVHQMISTVKGVLNNGIDFAEVLRATFPMGSMTGAPKKRVIELIGQFETSNRGIFSGATGYITPAGDFDFNVVIRSIMYNAHTRYLNYIVGGAITHYSNPENEYEECLLKAAAMEKVLKTQ